LHLASLKGVYGTILTGTKPSGPPPAPLEQMIGVALSTFDGQGHSTGIDNIHGTISGGTPDRPGTGTYTIDEDCTGTAILVNAGAPPFGNEVYRSGWRQRVPRDHRLSSDSHGDVQRKETVSVPMWKIASAGAATIFRRGPSMLSARRLSGTGLFRFLGSPPWRTNGAPGP